MSDATVQFIGSINSADTTEDQQRALYLKMFSGEVITAFEKYTVTLDKHSIRTIESGKSAQFPVIGRMPAAEYHTPGEEILGQEVKHNEKIITIDRLLISHVFLSDLDEAMSHFDMRSKYSQMMGQGLALTFDNHIMRELVTASGSATPITGDTTMAGKVISSNDFVSATEATKMAKWIDALFEAAETLDNNYVVGKRFCLLKPADYYAFVQYVATNGFSAIHRDYGGNGSFAEGRVINIAGITLVPTPTLPTTDYSAEDYHDVDCSKVKAIVFTEDAVGTVKLMDLSIQSQWDIRRQGTLLVGRYAMGHGVLQAGCALTFKVVT